MCYSFHFFCFNHCHKSTKRCQITNGTSIYTYVYTYVFTKAVIFMQAELNVVCMCVVRGANANALISSYAATHVFFMSPIVFYTYVHLRLHFHVHAHHAGATLPLFVCVTALVACSASLLLRFLCTNTYLNIYLNIAV